MVHNNTTRSVANHQAATALQPPQPFPAAPAVLSFLQVYSLQSRPYLVHLPGEVAPRVGDYPSHPQINFRAYPVAAPILLRTLAIFHLMHLQVRAVSSRVLPAPPSPI